MDTGAPRHWYWYRSDWNRWSTPLHLHQTPLDLLLLYGHLPPHLFHQFCVLLDIITNIVGYSQLDGGGGLAQAPFLGGGRHGVIPSLLLRWRGRHADVLDDLEVGLVDRDGTGSERFDLRPPFHPDSGVFPPGLPAHRRPRLPCIWTLGSIPCCPYTLCPRHLTSSGGIAH